MLMLLLPVWSTRLRIRDCACLTMLALTCVATASIAQQACPEGRSSSATIGVGSFVCYGGNCILFDRTAAGPSHTFTVEPMLRGVPADGPAGGKLRDGDVIVAVDGALITTMDAGRRLATPVEGRPLRFRVRRRGAELETDVTPTSGCETPGISIADNPEAEARGQAIVRKLLDRGRSPVRAPLRAARAEEIPVDFGMTVECADCGWRLPVTGGALRWHSAEPPRVAAVEPGGPAARAGLRVGDVLDAIDDASFVGSDDSAVWSGLRAGRPARLRVHRDGKIMHLTIAPRRTSRNHL